MSDVATKEALSLTRPPLDFEAMPLADAVAALSLEGTKPLLTLLDWYARRWQVAFHASRAALAGSEALLHANAELALTQEMTRRIQEALGEVA